MSRTDGQPASGYGLVGYLHFKVNTSSVHFGLDSLGRTLMFVSNAIAIRPDEQLSLPTGLRTELVIRHSPPPQPTATNVPEWLEQSIRVSPNPASGYCMVESTLSPIRSVNICNPDGRTWNIEAEDKPNSIIVTLGGLPGGMYLLRVWTEAGVAYKKLAVSGR